MSNAIRQYVQAKINERKEADNFRSLKVVEGLTDFYSNDYLGFARDPELLLRIENEVRQHPKAAAGSTGSRLLSGNTGYAEKLEHQLAQFHNAPTALLFNSGFDANYGFLSSLPYRGDTIIYDELVHASIHDGVRNSKATGAPFAHNSISSLEGKLKSATGLKYVVVESIYSMDGDFAPLKEIAALCKSHEAGLIVDEAHATGIFGKNGAGIVSALGLEQECIARIHTFGKAIGAFGAAIMCTAEVKEFLINYCRPFIFSTALPFHALAAVKCAYEYLPEVGERRAQVFSLAQTFKTRFANNQRFRLINAEGPIQSLLCEGNKNLKELAMLIQHQGFDVRPILYPTVARGSERIRICLHSFNTEEEVIKLVEVINSL